jgi:hypothetical protein
MGFKDPAKAYDVISAMVEAGYPAARNRARINAVFNGNPPYTEAERESNRIETNVNFLEGTRIMAGARQQFVGAFTRTENYFTVNLDIGPADKRTAWSNAITKQINKVLKRSQTYTSTLESQLASVVLHGIGPVTWLRDTHWCPSARGVEDVLVPSATLSSLENLQHFAIRKSFTVSELLQLTRNGDPKGWNMPMVNAIVANLAKMDGMGNYQQTEDWRFPEEIEENFKENSGYYGSDKVPVVLTYDIYFLKTDKDGKKSWKRRILADPQTTGFAGIDAKKSWLYDPGERCYGEDISRIMHVQFADGAVVPPFRWHSVRSLGYLLYGVCHLQDRLRCRFTDSVFEQMLWMFRATSEGDGERLEKVDLFHLGVIPDGLSWVPQNERHVMDFNLVNGAMSMNRQLMAESAAQFQADNNDGTRKEMTATEVQARAESSNQLMGSMLARAYGYQAHQYREIARRFCEIDHPDCVKFRRKCEAEGVDPAVWKNFDDWDVVPEKVIGNGNKMLQIAQADRLMAVRPMLSPEGQDLVLHIYAEANTDDPKLASMIAPLGAEKISPAVERATLAWGTLISGQQVVLASEVNRVDYITTLLQMLDTELQRIEAAGGNPPQKEAFGLANVIAHIEEQMQRIAQDPHQEQNLKLFGDAIGNASNLVKAYIQRLQEAGAEQAQQGDPETDAKLQAMQTLAEAKARVTEANAAQKREQKEIQFQQDQARKNAAVVEEARRGGARVAAENAALDLRTAAEINRSRAKADNEPAPGAE